MKKIYLSVASALIGLASFGQSNLGFETWTTGNPNNWGLYTQEAMSMNTVVAASGGTATATPVEQSTPAAEGSLAAKLTSFTLSGATNAQYNGNWGSMVSQLFTTTQKIETISYQFKSQITAADSAVILVELYNDAGAAPSQTNIIGQGRSFIKGNNTSWTSGTITVNYFSTDAPVSARIVVVSSVGELYNGVAAVVPGSTIEIDDIAIQYSTEVPAANVTNVVATDIADAGDGSDLRVTFTVPSAEGTDVDTYYAVVMDPSLTLGMLQDPLTFVETNGYEITPNGSNQTYTFAASDVYWKVNQAGTAVESTPIVENQPLKVWIYVKAQAGKTDVYASSNQITLTSPLAVEGLISEAVKLYPNPATDILTIEFGTATVTGVNIINLSGQVISNNSVNNGTVKVDVSNLQSGMYIYQAVDANGSVLKTDKFSKR